MFSFKIACLIVFLCNVFLVEATVEILDDEKDFFLYYHLQTHHNEIAALQDEYNSIQSSLQSNNPKNNYTSLDGGALDSAERNLMEENVDDYYSSLMDLSDLNGNEEVSKAIEFITQKINLKLLQDRIQEKKDALRKQETLFKQLYF